MNNKVILKIVVICAAVFLVFGILTAVFAAGTSLSKWKDGFSWVGNREAFEYHKNKNFDLDEVTDINITTVSTDVVFYQSEEELEITLDCYGYSNKETVTLETAKVGSSVTVKIKYPTSFLVNINITESLLQIGIPQDYGHNIYVSGVSSEVIMNDNIKNSFSELEVDTISGNIDIECTQIDLLDLDSISGELFVDNTILGSVFADTTSGDMEIRNISSENGQLEIDTVSGKVNIFYDVLCETRVNTTSGDVNLTFPSESVIDLSFESTSGDLRGNYNTNSDGIYVFVDTTSGDLNINRD